MMVDQVLWPLPSVKETQKGLWPPGFSSLALTGIERLARSLSLSLSSLSLLPLPMPLVVSTNY